MTWMKWVKWGCQEQEWRDKVSEGKEHAPLLIQSALSFRHALGKKLQEKTSPGDCLPTNSSHTLNHRGPGTPQLCSLFQVTNPWLYSIQILNTPCINKPPGQELRILSYPGAQRCDLLKSSPAHSLVLTHSLCKILICISFKLSLVRRFFFSFPLNLASTCPYLSKLLFC